MTFASTHEIDNTSDCCSDDTPDHGLGNFAVRCAHLFTESSDHAVSCEGVGTLQETDKECPACRPSGPRCVVLVSARLRVFAYVSEGKLGRVARVRHDEEGDDDAAVSSNPGRFLHHDRCCSPVQADGVEPLQVAVEEEVDA